MRDNYGKKLSGVKVAIKKDNQPLSSKNTNAGKYDVIEIPLDLFILYHLKKMDM